MDILLTVSSGPFLERSGDFSSHMSKQHNQILTGSNQQTSLIYFLNLDFHVAFISKSLLAF